VVIAFSSSDWRFFTIAIQVPATRTTSRWLSR
jgi:hypothetical protein